MKYAVKHTRGAVQGLIRFNDTLPSGFIEISEEVYNQGIAESLKHLALFFESGDQIFSSNTTLSAQIAASTEKAAQRAQLRIISIELDLKQRLGEPTEDLQAEFDDLKLLYEG